MFKTIYTLFNFCCTIEITNKTRFELPFMIQGTVSFRLLLKCQILCQIQARKEKAIAFRQFQSNFEHCDVFISGP